MWGWEKFCGFCFKVEGSYECMCMYVCMCVLVHCVYVCVCVMRKLLCN